METTTDSGDSSTVTYQTVHDPSIVVGYVESSVTKLTSSTVITGAADDTYCKEVYFIFGSHLAWSYSWDLMNWTSFTNNINSSYNTLFEKEFAWAKRGDSAYATSGNMWAPDVIWNKEMGKWCMYMSINGCSWNSCICMLTADSLYGSWTYVGPVIYSGFTASGTTRSYTYTDYGDVTGDTSLASRYITSSYTCYDGSTACTSTTWNVNYGAHAIDPCVVYDDDGNLYMSYGSWSGGIYLIRLDASTGLRDYNYTYDYESGVSDPYMGVHLAGGNQVSGEASYIQKIGDYYYLFITYGALNATGGYNMRYYRSETIDGTYADYNGAKATGVISNYYSIVGMRTMSYYKWSYMTYGYTAEGHNSVLVDDDGRIYLVYHTRTNNGTELHEVRIHQMFVTENGWLVVSPFEYSGESLDDSTETDDVTGMYEVIFMKGTDHASLECNTGVALNLGSDGTVTGTGYAGTWSWSSTKGAPYVDVVITTAANSEFLGTYEGVFVEESMEASTAAAANINTKYSVGDTTMTFTLIQKLDGDGKKKSYQLSAWGYQYTTQITLSSISNTSTGMKISWKSNSLVDKYVVYRKTSGGSWTKLATTTSTTYTDTTAKSGTTYYYTVGYLSCGSSYTGPYGTNTKSKLRLSQPETPTIASATGGVKLTWTAVTGANTYYIYRKTSSGSWTKIGSSTTNSYTDTTGANNTKYYYSIRVYNSSSAYSTYSSTGTSVTYYKAPTVTVSNTTTGVKVSWTAVSGATKYRVYRKTASGSWETLTTGTSSTSYTDTTASSGTKYYYRVRVYKSSSAYGAYSSSVAKTYVKAPTISSVSNTSGGVKVTWGKITGATKYYVYRKTSSGSWTKIATVTGTSYTDTAVKSNNGTTYYYTVRAYGGATSAYRAGTKTVRLTAPTISSLTCAAAKSLTLKYAKNSKATGYQIQYATSSSFSSYKTVWVSSSSTLTKKLTSLTKNKTYYVRVRAYKTVSGTKYYSAWSSVKSKKVTK